MKTERTAVVPVDGLLVPRMLLTKRQLACLTFLFRYLQEHGQYPTQRQIAEEMQLRSTSAVMYLSPLEKKGALVRIGRGPRNIRITTQGLQVLEQAGLSVVEQLSL